MPRVRYMNKTLEMIYNLSQYPNFSVTGSVEGMKSCIMEKTHCLCEAEHGFIKFRPRFTTGQNKPEV